MNSISYTVIDLSSLLLVDLYILGSSAISKNAAMKVSTRFFLYTHITVSLKDISKTGIAGHGLCTFSTLLGTAVASHVVVPVCTPARSG